MKFMFICSHLGRFMRRTVLRLSACLLSALALFHTASAGAQTSPSAAPRSSEAVAGPIQDNSFLIEEAYNQEYGVVQHINTLSHSWASHDWVYTFTQEWPMGKHYRHQLSYTLSGVQAGAFPGSGPGLGDLALNYRYQLVGSGETRVAFAPRFTLLLPTGNPALGRGYGGAGVQVNLPLSVGLGQKFVTHWNLGTTIIPSARNAAGERAPARGYNLGQSTIWLAKPRFNVVVETVWSGAETVIGPDATQRSHSFLISPGIRWAHNLPHGLQIVPGIGVPLGVGPSRGERGVFLYLSLEHPFTRTDAK
jgi:hypothetical protein